MRNLIVTTLLILTIAYVWEFVPYDTFNAYIAVAFAFFLGMNFKAKFFKIK